MIIYIYTHKEKHKWGADWLIVLSAWGNCWTLKNLRLFLASNFDAMLSDQPASHFDWQGHAAQLFHWPGYAALLLDWLGHAAVLFDWPGHAVAPFHWLAGNKKGRSATLGIVCNQVEKNLCALGTFPEFLQHIAAKGSLWLASWLADSFLPLWLPDKAVGVHNEHHNNITFLEPISSLNHVPYQLNDNYIDIYN